VARRISLSFSLILAALAASLVGSSPAAAAIGPPWCGTPIPDATAALPDGTGPNDPVGSYPHIPWYAIGCTLDGIAAQSNGRMTVEVIGQSALGRDMYLVTINALDTAHQKKSFKNWQQFRKLALKDPKQAQIGLWSMSGALKVPLYVQAGIHGNESEGIDASLQIIERLATTPYGTDPEVDAILDDAIVLFNVIQNPDGHILNQRANGNNFDLNRDFLTQSQSETRASISVMQKWLPPDMLDLHGYVTPTLVEATTKPHNPSIEYDLWLKWNQSRIDANEAAMNAIGMAVTRPINDWCPNGSAPPASTGLCAGGITPGPAVAEGWDDWGPFYTPMYAQHIGLNGSTVEMCNSTGTACGVPGSTTHPRGRVGSRTAQYTVVWSTLLFDVSNAYSLTWDQAEVYIRGAHNEPRPACCPAPFDVANNWMTEYPDAHVIPVGNGQRSDAEANRVVEWLFANQVEVWQTTADFTWRGQTFQKGSYIVFMAQPRRGLANTALGIGDDVSSSINQLYAPPAAWSHGYLWGADIVTIPRNSDDFYPDRREIKKPARLSGGVDKGKADRYVLEIDSATAVRTLNELVGSGVTAQIALTPFNGTAGLLAAGSAVFAADLVTKEKLDTIGKERALHFQPALAASLPALDPVDHAPRIAVLTGAINQDVWSLQNLGFTADPISTATINTALTDPLEGYDVVFNTGNWPSAANPLARTRLTAFFARGGGYLGAGAAGGTFLTTGAELVGLTTATRGGNGRSGILNWENSLGAVSPIVGAYPTRDTLIADPPTWFSTLPTTLAADARLPATGILAAGLWLMDPQSASAPGSAVIAHGTNAAGTARVTLFANNPLYRADPEREWPSLGAAAYWVDQ
jgi:Zinc carboxypeptidase